MAWGLAGWIFLTSMSWRVGLIPVLLLFMAFTAPAVSCAMGSATPVNTGDKGALVREGGKHGFFCIEKAHAQICVAS